MPSPSRLLASLLAAFLLAAPAPRLCAQAETGTASSRFGAESGIKAEFQALFGKISAKLQAGQRSEADLADELKAFDTLLAKYAADKSDDAAMVALMKARLYIEVFDNTPKGLAILRQVKTDFPATKIAQGVDGIIAEIEKQAALEGLLAVGKPFPAFAEKDLDGKPLALANFKGRVVLVDFWATWCGPCVAELPNVQAAYTKYHAKGFEIIGISLDQDRDKLTAFLKEKDIPWAQYFDGLGWQSKLGQQFGINSIPATFLLDRDGIIIARNLRGEGLGFKLGTLLP